LDCITPFEERKDDRPRHSWSAVQGEFRIVDNSGLIKIDIRKVYLSEVDERFSGEVQSQFVRNKRSTSRILPIMPAPLCPHGECLKDWFIMKCYFMENYFSC
jgi:hypothetical protein